MPIVLRDFLPVDERVLPSPRAMLLGIGLGVWTAGVYALMPLLGIRDVSPLATLRRDADPPARHYDAPRIFAALLLAGSVVTLAAIQVGSWWQGAWFAGGIGVALLALWLTSLGLIRLARRWTPSHWSYVWRQGLANLHRPANQTVTVVLALGFGAFLLTTLFTAQHNLLRDFRFDGEGDRPNLLLFDIQGDQRDLVRRTLRLTACPPEISPDVPSVCSRGPAAPCARSWRGGRSWRRHDRGGRATGGLALAFPARVRSTTGRRWAGERVTEGTGSAGSPWVRPTPDDPVEISMETELAAELLAGVGDRITWDLQGGRSKSRELAPGGKLGAVRAELFCHFARRNSTRRRRAGSPSPGSPTPPSAAGSSGCLRSARQTDSVDLGDVQRAIDRWSTDLLAIRFMAPSRS